MRDDALATSASYLTWDRTRKSYNLLMVAACDHLHLGQRIPSFAHAPQILWQCTHVSLQALFMYVLCVSPSCELFPALCFCYKHRKETVGGISAHIRDRHKSGTQERCLGCCACRVLSQSMSSCLQLHIWRCSFLLCRQKNVCALSSCAVRCAASALPMHRSLHPLCFHPSVFYCSSCCALSSSAVLTPFCSLSS